MNFESLICANYVEFCCKRQMCMLILKCEETTENLQKSTHFKKGF